MGCGDPRQPQGHHALYEIRNRARCWLREVESCGMLLLGAGLGGWLASAVCLLCKRGHPLRIGLPRRVVKMQEGHVGVDVYVQASSNTGLTEAGNRQKAHWKKSTSPLVPMGGFGREGEWRRRAVWLCSDASSYITGHCMVIDGGAFA